MATVRSQLLDAVVVALTTSRPSGIPAAARRRVIQLTPETLPAMDVAPVEEQVQPATNRPGPLVKRTLRFKVRCWACGDAPEVASDAMVAWAVRALAGNSLGGLVHELEELGTTWLEDVGETVFGVAEVEFAANYQSRTTDQEQRA